MLQKKMESMTMIVMPQMTEFVKKDVVLQHMRQTDDIEIQIDIITGRTAAPVGGIMLNRNPIVFKTISGSQLDKP